MPIASNLQLGIQGTNSGLYRNSTGSAYPYSIASIINITGSSASQPGYYYFFYDIEVEAVCLNTTEVNDFSQANSLSRVFNVLGSNAINHKNQILF